MRITFIRHAQSLHNATGDIIVNCGLSNAGVEQAKKIDISFDCVVLSPLRRTLQTYALSQIKTKVVSTRAVAVRYQQEVVAFLRANRSDYPEWVDLSAANKTFQFIKL